MLLPYLRPRFARWAAHEDVGVVLAFLVLDPEGIPVVPGKAAAGEDFVGFVLGNAEGDDGGGLRGRIAAQPRRVCGADGRRQVVGRTKNLNRALLAVVANCDAEVGLLLRGQGITN